MASRRPSLTEAGSARALAETQEPEDARIPSLDLPYTCRTFDNPDGSTTLVLLVYPFTYHPLSAESQYYRHYEFTITTMTAALAITRLTTGARVYEPGDLVEVDLRVQNDDPTLDVVVEADIRTPSGTVVAGLLLHSLYDLGGPVAFAPSWDSMGTTPGDYRVAVTLRDTKGAVLDQEQVAFQLGTTLGEVTELSVEPETFASGPLFDITLVFSNTGTVPITGTAVVQVFAQGVIKAVAAMTTTLENVLPGTATTFAQTWDATGLPQQNYRVQGQVKYNGQATPLVFVDLPLSYKIYLPTVLR